MIVPARHLTLDGLRGIAVMGILLMNIVDFALPRDAYLHPPLGGTRAIDVTAWAAEFVLADGKLRNLFSLLFGASMLLVAERAEAAGRSGAATHYRRMIWLLPIGLAHLYLLWWGDILHHYALVGALAFLFRDRPPHALVTLAIVVLVLDLLLLGTMATSLWSLRAAATAPGASAALIDRWLASGLAGPPAAADIAREIGLYRGGYLPILRDRLDTQADLPLLELLTAGPETFALMLLGMAALKSGFVTGGWSRAGYRRVVLVAYGLGLPVMAGLALWCIASGFDRVVTYSALMVGALPVRALLMFGHAALLVPWFAHGSGALRARIAAVGRMALSNYLLTSLLMTGLFYGYGAGRFATMGHAALLLPVLGMWGLMLLWSAPWLDRFAYGPAEWLWRSLARGAIQPLRAGK